MILTNDEVIQLKTAHQWPADTDPDFWTKVGGLIDQGIPEHASALKAWWLVRGCPFGTRAFNRSNCLCSRTFRPTTEA